MNIKQLIETLQSVQLPSQTDAMAAVNQADSIEDLKSLCELTEDGGVDGVLADLHIRALRRFVEVSQPSDLDKYSIAWMAGMHDKNVRDEKREILRDACVKGGAFTEVYLDAGGEDGQHSDIEVGNLSLSTEGGIVLICREGDWEVSLEEILGEPLDVKGIVLSDQWNTDDSRLSALFMKLSDNYLRDLESIMIVNVNDAGFRKWIDAFRNADLLNATGSLRRLFVESDGEFVPSSGSAKVEGKNEKAKLPHAAGGWWDEDATFVYERDALKRILDRPIPME